MGMKLHRTGLALAVALALGLTGCHHHHHSDGGNDNPQPDPPQPQPVVDGPILDAQVLLGAVENATSCADLNANGACDSNEPGSQTDASGLTTLTFSKEQVEAVTSSGSLAILNFFPAGSTNTILGTNAGSTTSDWVTSGTIYNPVFQTSSEAPSSNPPVISPFTTLTEMTFSQAISEDEYSKRLDTLADALAIDKKAMRTNYNDTSAFSRTNVRVLVADELLVMSGILPRSFSELQEIKNDPVDIETLTGNLAQIRQRLDEVMAQIPEDVTLDDMPGIIDKLTALEKQYTTGFASLSSGKGENFRCASTTQGMVVCWGSNAWANLGDPALFTDADGNALEDGTDVDGLYSHEPVLVLKEDGTPLTGVKQVEVGSNHAVAVTFTGNVYTWGSNYLGQSGTGSIEKPFVTTAATKVVKGLQDTDGDYLSDVVGVWTSKYTNYVITKDKKLYGWGDNSSLQLGKSWPDYEVTAPYAGVTETDGAKLPDHLTLAAVPYPVPILEDLAIDAVATGEYTFCALADVTDSEDKHNLWCGGGDPGSLFSNLSDAFPRDDSGNVLSAETDKIRERYALSAHLQKEYGSWPETPQTLSGKGWTCKDINNPEIVVTDVEKVAALSQAAKNAPQLNPDANYRMRPFVYNFYDLHPVKHLSGRDWMVMTSDGLAHPWHFHPVTQVTAIHMYKDEFYSTYGTEEDYDAMFKDNLLELVNVTNVGFGIPMAFTPYGSQMLADETGTGSKDSQITVGLLTDRNSKLQKTWFTVGLGFDKQGYECKNSEGTIMHPMTHAPRLTGQMLVNDSGKLSESGKPELLNCQYYIGGGSYGIASCDGPVDSYDGEALYPENAPYKYSANSTSTCVLTNYSDAPGTITCWGRNPFGQVGFKPSTATKSHSKCQKDWKYILTGLNLQYFESYYDGDDKDEKYQAMITSMVNFLRHHSNSQVSWLAPSTSCMSTFPFDDPLMVSRICGSHTDVQYNALANDCLESADVYLWGPPLGVAQAYEDLEVTLPKNYKEDAKVICPFGENGETDDYGNPVCSTFSWSWSRSSSVK